MSDTNAPGPDAEGIAEKLRAWAYRAPSVEDEEDGPSAEGAFYSMFESQWIEAEEMAEQAAWVVRRFVDKLLATAVHTQPEEKA